MTIQTPSEKNTSQESFVQTADLEQQQPTKSLRLSSLRYDALLVLVTIIWGGTFLVTKNAITQSGPFTYLALCYSIATLTLAVIFHKRLWHITRFELISGLISAYSYLQATPYKLSVYHPRALVRQVLLQVCMCRLYQYYHSFFGDKGQVARLLQAYCSL